MQSAMENENLLISKIIVNELCEDEFCVKGYEKSKLYTAFFYILGSFSLGLLFLLAYWYPVKRLKFTHYRSSFNKATSLLVKQSLSGEHHVVQVLTIYINDLSRDPNNDGELAGFEVDLFKMEKLTYFEHMFLTYHFSKYFDNVKEISGLDNMLTLQQLHKMADGISKHTSDLKHFIYEFNSIQVPMKSYFVIFVQLAMNPFYVFQVFSCTLWYTDDYLYFATLVLLMTLMSLIVTSYETKTYMKKLYDMVGGSVEVQVLRDRETISIDSHQLVPGDVMLIPHDGLIMPCDAVLLSGRCVVNESSLTGESFPNTKTYVDDLAGDNSKPLFFSMNEHKRHALFSGTKILEAHRYGSDEKVKALVIRTGFCTLKGRLIRSIIHPKPMHFTFFRDSMKFLMVFCMIAFCGFVYTVVLFVRDGATPGKIIRKSLDLFTIAIPPSLPACMSVGIMSAMRHLKSNQIFCIDPNRINFCGKIKLFVFDKTGTLTNDTLTVGGVVTVDGDHMSSLHKSHDKLGCEDEEILEAMSSCHGLNIINGNVLGDPLDQSMVEFTQAKLSAVSLNDSLDVETQAYMNVTPYFDTFKPFGIYKQYMFESSLQRMSVVVQTKGQYRAYVKGSPEKIASLCLNATLPSTISDVLEYYARQGCRVLAVATKQLSKNITFAEVKKLPRGDVECELKLLGLIIFQNDVKDSTPSTIKILQEANIRCIMATGDNLMTAARVARDVNMIKEFQSTVQVSVDGDDVIKYMLLNEADVKADSKKKVTNGLTSFSVSEYQRGLPYSVVMTGDTYFKIKKIDKDLGPKLLLSASVFARMSPNQKSELIEDLKELNYGVGMCGDGANDCGALKAAHAGIALSDTEASVASPFTSKIFDISCVPKLISEGRASLVTSFDTFKYMAFYSFIQFFGVVLLYHVNSNYSNFEFLYADLVLSLSLVFAMTQSKANPNLVMKRPNGRLIHPIFIFGIILQLLIQLIFQVCCFLYVQHMPWYKEPSTLQGNTGGELYFYAYENVTVMIISFFQYIICSIVCMSGRPYRLPIYTNHIYLVVVAMTTVLTVYISVYPAAFIRKVLEFAQLPSYEFSLSLLALAVGNLCISLFIEKVLIPSESLKSISNSLRRKTQPKNLYKSIYVSVTNDCIWPPIR